VGLVLKKYKRSGTTIYRSDDPEQYRAIGWVKGVLFSVIYEIREDDDGEYYHLVTLWKSTKQEIELYESYIQE